MSYRKIGIMGGTFDPIHNAHLQLAQEALESQDLNQVIFIPAGQPNFKQNRNILEKDTRKLLVELGIQDNDQFIIDDFELRKDSLSYTIDTIEYLQRKYPKDELFFILGEDALLELPKWHRSSELKNKISFLVAKRSLDGFSKDLDRLRKLGYNIIEFPFYYLEISSTMIREKRRNNREIRYLVPQKVGEFIKERKLYR
ncbi:MAG: nicotinate-nucleotide adenylyltransferase [Tissierellia bacterium]|nr:nicotinate-nucleotide adenylyltransferase [Tissierellia bacterium]